MANPIAIREAKKIAEEAALRKLSYGNIWITKPAAGVFDEYQVWFSLPGGIEGAMVCKLPLTLTPEEFADYEAWSADRF